MPYILLAISILLGSYNFWSHCEKNQEIQRLQSHADFFRECYNERNDQLQRAHAAYLESSDRANRFRLGISKAIYDLGYSYSHDLETGKIKLYPPLPLPAQTLRWIDFNQADHKDHALYAEGDDGC